MWRRQSGRSPSAVHRPPLTVHRSPSAVRRSPSTARRSPSAARRPPSAVRRRPPYTVQCWESVYDGGSVYCSTDWHAARLMICPRRLGWRAGGWTLGLSDCWPAGAAVCVVCMGVAGALLVVCRCTGLQVTGTPNRRAQPRRQLPGHRARCFSDWRISSQLAIDLMGC